MGNFGSLIQIPTPLPSPPKPFLVYFHQLFLAHSTIPLYQGRASQVIYYVCSLYFEPRENGYKHMGKQNNLPHL